VADEERREGEGQNRARELPLIHAVNLFKRPPMLRRPSVLLFIVLIMLSAVVHGQKTVHVKGYVKKDGTVVKPYDRRAAGSATTPDTSSTSATTVRPSTPASGQAAPVSTEDYSREPSTVFLVTGQNATALFHRAGCPWLRLGGNQSLAIEEAKKRYFQPHCQCVSGKDSVPPCTFGGLVTAPAQLAQPPQPAPAARAAFAEAPSVSSAATETVYVTKTGTKYHRAGCRSLSSSQIPMKLADAAARYGPCSICKPPLLPAATPTTQSFTDRANGNSEPATIKAESGRCQAITKAGAQCKRNAQPGSKYCWQHAR
jgi:hypothetical protein